MRKSMFIRFIALTLMLATMVALAPQTLAAVPTYTTLTYTNGNTYAGGTVNKTPDGYGVLTYKDGGSYAGEFSESKLHGYGFRTFSDGSSYTGHFYNNKLFGQGYYEFADGAVYAGSFAGGTMNGFGMLTTASGTTTIGTYDDGLPDGYVVTSFTNGNLHVGEIKDGTYDGTCIRIEDSCVYVGNYANNQKNGNGTMFYTGTLCRTTGTYQNGAIHGNSFQIDKNSSKTLYTRSGGKITAEKKAPYKRMTYADGSEYYGEVSGTKRQGFGTMTMSNGDYYAGDFSSDKRCGYGYLLFADGTEYWGEFSGDKANGLGCYFDSENDTIYIGQFKNDVPNGFGYIDYGNGMCYAGSFSNNTFVGSGMLRGLDYRYIGPFSNNEFSGTGLYVTDDFLHMGRFSGNSANGDGVQFFPNGTYTQGSYKAFDMTGSGTYYNSGKFYNVTWTDGKVSSLTEKYRSSSGASTSSSSTPPGSTSSTTRNTVYIPSMQSFSGNKLELRSDLEADFSGATTVGYYMDDNTLFASEYVALLQKLGFTLLSSKSTNRTERYILVHNGVSNVPTFRASTDYRSAHIVVNTFEAIQGSPRSISISYANGFEYLESSDRTTQKLENYNNGTSHYNGTSSGRSGSGVPEYEKHFETPNIYCTECRNTRKVDCDLCDGDGNIGGRTYHSSVSFTGVDADDDFWTETINDCTRCDGDGKVDCPKC